MANGRSRIGSSRCARKIYPQQGLEGLAGALCHPLVMLLSRKIRALAERWSELAGMRVNAFICEFFRLCRLLGGRAIAYLSLGFALPAHVLCHPARSTDLFRHACGGCCMRGGFCLPCWTCRDGRSGDGHRPSVGRCVARVGYCQGPPVNGGSSGAGVSKFTAQVVFGVGEPAASAWRFGEEGRTDACHPPQLLQRIRFR